MEWKCFSTFRCVGFRFVQMKMSLAISVGARLHRIFCAIFIYLYVKCRYVVLTISRDVYWIFSSFFLRTWSCFNDVRRENQRFLFFGYVRWLNRIGLVEWLDTTLFSMDTPQIFLNGFNYFFNQESSYLLHTEKANVLIPLVNTSSNSFKLT